MSEANKKLNRPPADRSVSAPPRDRAIKSGEVANRGRAQTRDIGGNAGADVEPRQYPRRD